MSGSQPRPSLRFEGGGRAELVGNHVALDLVNTVAWRLDTGRSIDRLPDGMALVRWARFAGVIGAGSATAFERQVTADADLGDEAAAAVRNVRERLYRVLEPLTAGRASSDGDVETLRRCLLETVGRAELVGVMPLQWTVRMGTVSDLPLELSLAAWRLLESEDRQRLRQCRDETCGWLFLDRTKNGSRVWCSSADCGNRTRARRHYQRHARSSPAAPPAEGSDDS